METATRKKETSSQRATTGYKGAVKKMDAYSQRGSSVQRETTIGWRLEVFDQNPGKKPVLRSTMEDLAGTRRGRTNEKGKKSGRIKTSLRRDKAPRENQGSVKQLSGVGEYC